MADEQNLLSEKFSVEKQRSSLVVPNIQNTAIRPEYYIRC